MRRLFILFVLAVMLLGLAAPAQADTLGQVVRATWPADLAPTATGVAYLEGGGNFADGYCGFGIIPSTAAAYNINTASSDPYYCSQQAYRIYQDAGGWSPWTTYPPGGAAIAAGESAPVIAASGAASAYDAPRPTARPRVHDRLRTPASDASASPEVRERPERLRSAAWQRSTAAAQKPAPAWKAPVVRDRPNPEPTPSVQVHIVQPGDTLSGIAAQYGTTYQHLAQINGIENPNLIFAGQHISIE